MKTSKYTKEKLSEVVQDSISWAEVLRKFGCKQTGGMQHYIKNLATFYGISTTHFLGQRANSGSRHKGGKKRLDCLRLYPANSPKLNGARLKQALLGLGREYRCESCGNTGEWLGTLLVLHVDHINGIPNDNREENLRFLCPNCHSQTPTYSNKKRPHVS